nr:hypothetical protein [Tanacetum cinerariifolium]
MATTIEQQVAMDEALVPSTQRLRIGRSNFRLPSDIQSKESTLQLVYDVLRRCPFFKAFLVTADVPDIYMQEFWATAYVHQHNIRFKMNTKNHIVVSRHQNTQQYGAMLPIELTNDEIRNTKAYEEYYAFATGEAVPKPKTSARRKRSDSDTSITPPTATLTPKPTAAATPRLTAIAKAKQPAKATKAKSLSALSESGGSDKDGDERDDDEENQEVAKFDEKDDAEGGGDDNEESESYEENDDEETRDEESFDAIPKNPKSSEVKSDDEEDQGLNIGGEGHVDEEEEDELYRDVNINQGRGLQVSQDVEDSYVTLTLVYPDGKQESSSVSSQFMTSMLNPLSDAGMESIFATASSSVAPITTSTLIMTSSTNATITTTSQAPIPPTPNLRPSKSTYFCLAVSAILSIVDQYMNQQMNKAVRVAVQIQTDQLRNSYQRENDEFL